MEAAILDTREKAEAYLARPEVKRIRWPFAPECKGVFERFATHLQQSLGRELDIKHAWSCYDFQDSSTFASFGIETDNGEVSVVFSIHADLVTIYDEDLLNEGEHGIVTNLLQRYLYVLVSEAVLGVTPRREWTKTWKMPAYVQDYFWYPC